jgi:glutamyl-tRNA reductase
MLLQKTRLLEQAKSEGIESLLLRLPATTEIYGFAEPIQLIKLICENSRERLKSFKSRFVYKNQEAINHIFVGTGLDSQILGDFEIISKSDRVLHSQNL